MSADGTPAKNRDEIHALLVERFPELKTMVPRSRLSRQAVGDGATQHTVVQRSRDVRGLAVEADDPERGLISEGTAPRQVSPEVC